MTDATPRHCAIRVAGVVQGVGFRPFVHGLAGDLGLSGHVGNDADGVFIEIEGSGCAVAEFVERLRSQPPVLASVESVSVTELPTVGLEHFRIVASPTTAAGAAATSIPPDVATCPECLGELRDPNDRRYGYPFIACTNCGPRFTMVTGLPYDRDNTTMAQFPLCAACRADYEDPGGRRYHAQPTACWVCGPRLTVPVADIVATLAEGRIVALKGIGGYHLACDAGNAAAVQRLRQRKQRGAKPFAVMAASPEAAARIGIVTPVEFDLLSSRARPIVLVTAKDVALSRRVAPGNNYLGVMLPYTPLHHLLFDAGAADVLVMTSGNLSDEPICTDPAEARERLAGLADLFVDHNRRITVACDDSVTRVVAGAPQPIRRSRGYAPLPVALPVSAPSVLAVGGELKTTAGIAHGRQAWLTQHIGDTKNPHTLAMLERSADVIAQLQQVSPELVVSDAHPGYLSRKWAADRARERGWTHLTVQHHHAHLASLLAEHKIPPDEPVLGVTFDGSGYGTDGTIWGGELLVGSYSHVERVGHLRSIALPGGDAATRNPSRTGIAHLIAAGLVPSGTAAEQAHTPAEQRLLEQMLATGSHCTPTTSVGRLFDAVASLLAVRQSVDYEGQAAIELEALAAAAEAPPWEATVATEDQLVIIEPGGWIARAVTDRRDGVPVAVSARAFHAGVASAVVTAAIEIRHGTGVGVVGLTGGVFANALLSADCVIGLSAAGFQVLVHRVVPPNDGGLALGQIAVAAVGGAMESQERYGD